MVSISLRLEMPNCTETYKHFFFHSSLFWTSTSPLLLPDKYFLLSLSLLLSAKLHAGRSFIVFSSISVLSTLWSFSHNMILKKISSNGCMRKPEWQHLARATTLTVVNLISLWMLERDLNLDPFAVFPQDFNWDMQQKCSNHIGNTWNICLNLHFHSTSPPKILKVKCIFIPWRKLYQPVQKFTGTSSWYNGQFKSC